MMFHRLTTMRQIARGEETMRIPGIAIILAFIMTTLSAGQAQAR